MRSTIACRSARFLCRSSSADIEVPSAQAKQSRPVITFEEGEHGPIEKTSTAMPVRCF